MNFIRHVWFGALVLLGGCVLPVGCQVSRQQTAQAPAPRETAPPLNAKQQADLQVAFARSLEKNGAGDQAKAAYEDALKKDPQRADALDRLAVIHARQGQFEQAVALHKKALAIQPRNADFVCNLGYNYYLQQRWAEAEIQFRKAIELAPNHSRAHNNLGLVLARTVRSEQALAAFRRSGCSEADAHSNLAFALSLENSLKEAQEHFARARTLDPASELAEDGLRVVNAQLNGQDKVSTAAVMEKTNASAVAPPATMTIPATPKQVATVPSPARLRIDQAPAPVKMNVALDAPVATSVDSSLLIQQVSGTTPPQEPTAPGPGPGWMFVDPPQGEPRDSKIEPTNR
jgi:tetratricopeptide (TPR) repeat protein